MDKVQQATEVAGILGVDVATATTYLVAANYNSQIAISNFFDGVAPAPAPLIDTNDAFPLPNRCMPPPRPPIGIPRPIPPIIRLPPEEWLPIRTRLVTGKQQEVPLHALNVVVNVVNFVAQVQVNHRFVNSESNPIEAVFLFQQDDVSIYEFEVEIDGKRIQSACKEKEAAFNKYDDAIASGNTGFLLSKETEDEFKLNVGNLPPKASCIVSIKYSVVLSTEGDALKLSVPITRVPLRLYTHPVQTIESVKYPFPNGISLNANIKMASPIVGIECESHDIDYDVNGNIATVSIRGDPTTQPNKDFSILVGLQDPHVTSSAVVESLESKSKNSNSRDNTVMLSYYPKIESTEDDIPMEYVFLVDRSGSMSGSKNTQLVNALQLFLRSIPMGSLFNIIGFGSHYENLFPNSIVYDDESFAKATQYASNLKANFGGTDILPPLYNILSKSVHPLFPRQVFILTDGEVNNTEEVIRMVRKNIGITRIFTLGIGAEASKRLVAGIARAGKGQAEFTTSGTRMEPKVLAQLKRAMQPHVSVEVDWGSLKDVVKQAPSILPPIFPGDPIVVFGILDREVRESDKNIILKVKPLNKEANIIPVIFDSNPQSGSMIGVLAASSIVNDVERKLDDKTITQAEAKAQIVPLAIKFSLVTRYTSLVAEEVRDDPVEGTMEVRTIGELVPPIPIRKQPPQRNSYLTRYMRQSSVATPAPSYQQSFGSSSSTGGDRYGGSKDGLAKPTSASFARRSAPTSAATSSTVMKSKKMTNEKEKRQIFDDNSSDDEAELDFDSFAVQEECAPVSQSSFYAQQSLPTLSQYNYQQSAPALPPPTSAPKFKDPFVRPLDLFVVLQQASGNWTISPSFLEAISKTQAQLETIFGKFVNWESNVVATALAIAFLETRFAATEEEWSLLRDKASRWATKELQKNNGQKNFADYIQLAYTCFTN